LPANNPANFQKVFFALDLGLDYSIRIIETTGGYWRT
jgi:hypothetical protein